MLLVYTHKITPRLRYSFKHFFESVLGIEVGFTTKFEMFIAHIGPKMSYSDAPLGNEFFVKSNSLLFEQGVQDIEIQVSIWDELPAFFETSKNSMLPYDVFAATFFLISRYEEYLVHVKDESGRFISDQSLAVQNDFLEIPIIDLWAKKTLGLLVEKFPDIEIAVVAHGSEQFELTKDNDKKQKKSHDLVKRITLDDTPVHICEAHANWRGVKAEEFPDYINVSASGPSQIRQYQELDYILVVIH